MKCLKCPVLRRVQIFYLHYLMQVDVGGGHRLCSKFMKHSSRRENLLNRMEALEAEGLSCIGCAGNCCTFEGNSMMTTPLEAAEILLHLKASLALNEELKEKLKATISKFRLDHPLGNGRRSFVRKSYTCPFFNHQELGCPLPREVKPYGCLAFNSHHSEKKAGEFCYSEKDLLLDRESLNISFENQVNQRLREKFNLFWEKTPLPLALLDIWEKEITSEDLKLG